MVDICLIPEVPFELPKLLEHVDKILAAKGHCVVCVAEGAGQNLAQVGSQHDVYTDTFGHTLCPT